MSEHASQEEQAPTYWPSAPEYSFASSQRVTSLSPSQPSSDPNNFLRSARWAYDTVSVLTTAEDRAIRVVQTEEPSAPGAGEGTPTAPTPRAFPQQEAVYAAAWYPSASVASPETYCFIASVRDTPVKLLDASDGRLRASYPIVDHQERFVAPHSLAFTPGGDKLYCGFESAIEVFDVATPGYNTSTRIKTCNTRREKGQKGIISALAFSPHDVSSFAAGSYSGSVVLYDQDVSHSVGMLDGVVGGGVTQVAYHPVNPNLLLIASRRCNALQVYDLRNTSEQLAALHRPGSTNQRLSFDTDPWGRWIVAGDEVGTVRVWDSNTFELLMEERLADDAVSAVQLHPYKPLLLTLAGSRNPGWESDSESGSDAESESDCPSDTPAYTRHTRALPPPRDTRLSLWSMAP